MKENKIPSAEEFIKDNSQNPKRGWSQIKLTKEFAKLHVKAALKEASEKATVTPIDHEEISEGSFRPIWGVDDESILSAYPEELIK